MATAFSTRPASAHHASQPAPAPAEHVASTPRATHDAYTLFRERGARALWDRTLGHFDLTLEQTMALQHRLLGEQLARLNAAPYGRFAFGGTRPTSYRELRDAVPYTDYESYASVLGERREDLLAEPTRTWIRTSGRTNGQPRWIPLSHRTFEAQRWPALGIMVASVADEPGQVRLRGHERILNLMAPPPYASGTIFNMLADAWPVRVFPDGGPQSEALPFEERIAGAFKSALTEGVDFATSLASVLVGVGEAFGTRKPSGSTLERLKNVRALRRLVFALAKSKLAGRGVYPKDVWNLRGVGTGGMDSTLFRERIKEFWGRYPLEIFASTEGGVIATQGWDYSTLTLVPQLNFFEFIPEDQLERERPGSPPRAVLMDELEPERNYELVITNLQGGPLVRYRTGDIMRVTGMSNSKSGVALPQFVHYARRSDLLEIGGFVRLTEQTVWRAIEEAAVPYVDWTVRKEVDGHEPILHLRMEPRAEGFVPPAEAVARINSALARLEPDWADMADIAGLSPLRVSYLPGGCFQRYAQRKQAEGADLAHLKPMHMNPADSVVNTLLEVAAAGT
jgi:GH3 auxin-responsive promoter